MPLYTWECTDCMEVFEYIQKFEDAPPPCEKCGEKTERVITKTSLKFNDPHLKAHQRFIR